MIYFGIEIYDGRALKPFLLDTHLALEEQWQHLTQDVTCIEYAFAGFEFSIDVGWYPSAQVTPSSFFRTVIIEGPVTRGGIFLSRESTSLQSLKRDIQEAVDLIQKFKTLSVSEILSMQIR